MLTSTAARTRSARIPREPLAGAHRHASRRPQPKAPRPAPEKGHVLPDLGPSFSEVCAEVASVLAKPIFLALIIVVLMNVVARHTRARGVSLAKLVPQKTVEREEKLVEMKFAALLDASGQENGASAEAVEEVGLNSMSKELERAKFLDTLLSSKLEIIPPLPNAGSVAVDAQPSMQDPIPYPAPSIEDLKSEVKFIAGLIAVHRPSISDCGLVAKEIVRLSVRKKIDPFLVAAIISIESNFGAHERSHVGATGLMQLMPSTARAVAGTAGKVALTDVRTNISLGIDYYRQLEAKYNNRLLALAAYNWGPTNVDKVGKNFNQIPKSVKKYATTIVERNNAWASHFRKAKAGALSLDQLLNDFVVDEAEPITTL